MNQGKVDKESTVRDIENNKREIEKLTKKIEYYEIKQEELLNELKTQVQLRYVGEDFEQNLPLEIDQETGPEYSNSEGQNMRDSSYELNEDSIDGQEMNYLKLNYKKTKGRQNFFKVSKVDDQIAEMLDEGSMKVRQTIQKVGRRR